MGYFSPGSAANALAHFKVKQPFGCEMYSHFCHLRGKGLFDEEELLRVGRDFLRDAIRDRRRYREDGNPMSDYNRALALVARELRKQGCTSNMLAGWF